MANLIIVVGMPGSGKTHYLQKLLRDEVVDEVFDDFQAHPLEGDYLDPRKS